MFKNIIQFIKESRSELVDKTTWPNREQVLSTTVVVLVSIAVVSVLLHFIDYVLRLGVQAVLVESVSLMKPYITPISFFGFLALCVIVPIMYSRIKKRVS